MPVTTVVILVCRFPLTSLLISDKNNSALQLECNSTLIYSNSYELQGQNDKLVINHGNGNMIRTSTLSRFVVDQDHADLPG